MDRNELIALYLNKQLSDTQKKEFDHLIESDSGFAEEVLFQENLKIVIEKEERETVKSRLQGFEKEEKSSSNFKKIWIAASAIILLGISGFWYLNSKTLNTEALYSENFEPYRNIVAPIVRNGNNVSDIKTEAFKAYETKKYGLAIVYFNKLLKDNPDETIAFYKANSLLALNKTEAAISIFEQNLKTPDSLNDKNNWYLALAYLKQKNVKKAKEILKKLKASSFKKESVEQLLKALN